MEKKRKAAYVRVSTAQKAQLHSYEFQEQYWRDKLTEDPDTEFVGIYADKGISGCDAYKRPQFMAMMQDARDGKLDEIHTKSVSRFARNTVQLLEAVRELRDLGVEVYFEKENIHTFEPTSEVFLTIAASIAENDLQVDGERQRWSIKHRIQNGWISVGSKLYGYRMTKDNELEIIETEAEAVRMIFDMYTAGAGGEVIAKALNDAGYRTSRGAEWRSQSVYLILENEKFMGDTIMGKSVWIDGVKHDNSDGSLGSRYYMEGTHEGIVSKEVWEQAQQLRQQRKNRKLAGVSRPVYPFTGIIECANCGAHYQHKINNSGKKWRNPIWACNRSLRYGVKACSATRIKDEILREKFVEAYNEFVTTRPQGDTVAELQILVTQLQQNERELAGLAMQHLITEAAFRKEQQAIKAQIAALMEKINDQNEKHVRESDFEIITEFDATKVEKFITKVIMSRNVVTFVFYNGAKISKAYSNGQPGNKPGWNKKEA